MAKPKKATASAAKSVDAQFTDIIDGCLAEMARVVTSKDSYRDGLVQLKDETEIAINAAEEDIAADEEADQEGDVDTDEDNDDIEDDDDDE